MLDAIEPVFSGIDGWQRIYVDLPGCGGSVGFDHVESQDDVLAAIVEFVARVDGGRPLIRDGDCLEHLEPAVKRRAEKLVVQKTAIVEKIRRTKVPAAAAHDVDLEARVQARFEFSFHHAMHSTVFDRSSLILSGRQDSIAGFTDAVKMLGTYPRATYALLDCAGHSLSWERPDLFKALMWDWLERLEST